VTKTLAPTAPATGLLMNRLLDEDTLAIF